MVKFSDKGSGWHKDSKRHSRARSTGHAGGKYKLHKSERPADPATANLFRTPHAIAIDNALQARVQHPRRGPYGNWMHDPAHSDIEGIDDAKRRRTVHQAPRTIDTMGGYKRYKDQEDESVLRWYEKGDDIISVVKGYFPGETNVRFSSKKGMEEIRGSSSIIDKLPDSQIIAQVMRQRARIDGTQIPKPERGELTPVKAPDEVHRNHETTAEAGVAIGESDDTVRDWLKRKYPAITKTETERALRLAKKRVKFFSVSTANRSESQKWISRMDKEQIMGQAKDEKLKEMGYFTEKNRAVGEKKIVKDNGQAKEYMEYVNGNGDITWIDPKYEKAFNSLYPEEKTAPAYFKQRGGILVRNTKGGESIVIAPKLPYDEMNI